jgi:hypothetical protein
MHTLKQFTFLLLLIPSLLAAESGDKLLYNLNWKKPESFKVSGGVINAGYWEVRNDSCIFSTGNWLCNEKGRHQVQTSVELSSDGLLNASDQAIVYLFLNDKIIKTYVVKGNEVNSAKLLEYNFNNETVGVLKINIVLKSMGTDRAWQLKDNSIRLVTLSKEDDPDVNVLMAGSVAKITWMQKTTPLTNYFRIERSVNGIDFTGAGLVIANRNNEKNNYSFLDKITEGSAYYYRIIVRDLSGDEKQVGEIINTGNGSSAVTKSN